MFNNKGEVFYEQYNETIKPSLKFEEFRRMKLFLASENATTNMPYLMYYLPPILDREKVILLKLNFNKIGNLQTIDICDANEKYGTSWNDYTDEKERLRNKSTEEWIKQNGFVIDKYDWGEIKLVYDAKNGIYRWLMSITNCAQSI